LFEGNAAVRERAMTGSDETNPLLVGGFGGAIFIGGDSANNDPKEILDMTSTSFIGNKAMLSGGAICWTRF
jgi:predicted outer membrane repeat protein